MKRYLKCVYLLMSVMCSAFVFGDTEGHIEKGYDKGRDGWKFHLSSKPDRFDITDSVMTFKEFNVKPRGMEAHNVSTYEDIIVRVTGDKLSDINGELFATGNKVENLVIVNENGIKVGANGSFKGIDNLVLSCKGAGEIDLKCFDGTKMDRRGELRIVVQDFKTVIPNENGLPVKTGAIRKFWQGSYKPITIDYYFDANSTRPKEFAGLQGNVHQKGEYGWWTWGMRQEGGFDPDLKDKFKFDDCNRLMGDAMPILGNAPLEQAVVDRLPAQVLGEVVSQEQGAVPDSNFRKSYNSLGGFDGKNLKEVDGTLHSGTNVGEPTEKYSSFLTEYYSVTPFKELAADDSIISPREGPYDFWGQDRPTENTENMLVSMDGKKVIMLSKNTKVDQNLDLGGNSARRDLYNFWQLNTGLFTKENLEEMADVSDSLIKQDGKILKQSSSEIEMRRGA